MANKMFKAEVVDAKGKTFKKNIVVAGIADGHAEDEEGIDEEWVEGHIRSHLHKNPKSVKVEKVEDRRVPSGVRAALAQAVVDTGDKDLEATVRNLPPEGGKKDEPKLEVRPTKADAKKDEDAEGK